MSSTADSGVHWALWPLWALWRLVTFVLAVTGWLVCAVLGLSLMIVGSVATLSVVGAPIGIPLAVLGLLLLVRAVF